MKEQVFGPATTDSEGNEHPWRGYVKPVRNSKKKGGVFGKYATTISRGDETIRSTIIESEGHARRRMTGQGPSDGTVQAKPRRLFLGLPL